MRRSFDFFLIFLNFILTLSCSEKGRLNSKDPLSPFYQKETVFVVTNVNVIYTNSSIINQDTIWTKSMSPIRVLQNFLITDGAVLTIEAGVEVEFFAIGGTEVGIIVDNGGLKALGSITQPVKFHAKDGAFSYIVFRNTSINSKCELKYCDLSQITVVCIGAEPTLHYNKIMDLSLYSGSDSTIEFNDIATLNCVDSSPIIKNNLFFYSTYERNIILNGKSKPSIYSNNIMGSSAYCLKNLTSYTIYAPFNYWNANSTNEISAKIWDYFDNPTNLGPVIFEPFYTNQISWIGAGW